MSEWRSNRRTKKPFPKSEPSVAEAEAFIRADMERARKVLAEMTQRPTRQLPSRSLEPLMARHIYSYRDYPVGEFAAAYRAAENDGLEQSRIRAKYRSIEGGRLLTVMEDIHKMLATFDPDEIELFKSRVPELMKMLNEYAVVEDLREF